MYTFATRVKVLRVSLGLTQRQMAERLGVHPITYQAMEQGARSARGLAAAAAFFGVDPPERLLDRMDLRKALVAAEPAHVA